MEQVKRNIGIVDLGTCSNVCCSFSSRKRRGFGLHETCLVKAVGDIVQTNTANAGSRNKRSNHELALSVLEALITHCGITNFFVSHLTDNGAVLVRCAGGMELKGQGCFAVNDIVFVSAR